MSKPPASPLAPPDLRPTPGPWRAQFSEMGGYDCMTDAWRIVSGHQSIADLDLGSYGQRRLQGEFKSAEAEANAHLIAAAPELLAALQKAVETIRALHGLSLLSSPQATEETLWKLYQSSPEMQQINTALAKTQPAGRVPPGAKR